jgi:hypothetical protein
MQQLLGQVPLSLSGPMAGHILGPFPKPKHFITYLATTGGEDFRFREKEVKTERTPVFDGPPGPLFNKG